MVYRDLLTEDGSDLLEYGVRRRLAPDEDLDEVVSFITQVAGARAQVWGRPVDGFEMTLVASIFCWWPLRPRPPENYELLARQARGQLLTLASRRDFEFVAREISPFILESDPYALMDSIRQGGREGPFFF